MLKPIRNILLVIVALFILQACANTQAADAGTQSLRLTQPGHDIFGTIQEAVNRLLASESTDWQKVDTEALRQHLIDMKHFTEDVVVVSQSDIDGGALINIQVPDVALVSVERALAAHPAQLKQESGFDMLVEQNGNDFDLSVTTVNPDEVKIIRGLGYIGLMAYGGHHVDHHWMMISGQHPHN
ncbi:MAG: hypothetical protein OEZ58_04105 [Gammaproteobacteria bacterium]|nr:hypothetical protein [Gammaproteobacteria bacterium]MDH5728147.1 hypothetical protein [Gammaproteobacteria bacterium]